MLKHLIRSSILLAIALLAGVSVSAAPKPPATAPAQVQADGSLLLMPLGARIHGVKLRLEQEPTPTLVGWTDPNENIEWVKAAKKGRYEVEVTYACPPNAGGEFAVTAAAHRTVGHTENTGDWNTFKTLKLKDPLIVLNDNTSVGLRSTGNFNHVLMSVRGIKLVPLPPEKKK